LGVGPRPIPAKKISFQALQAALDQALNNQEMTAKAQRMGNLLKEEDGTTQALRIIEKYLEE
jgi:sterol 3beta-glucosyltransferase